MVCTGKRTSIDTPDDRNAPTVVCLPGLHRAMTFVRPSDGAILILTPVAVPRPQRRRTRYRAAVVKVEPGLVPRPVL